jgi:hypothetical protein
MVRRSRRDSGDLEGSAHACGRLGDEARAGSAARGRHGFLLWGAQTRSCVQPDAPILRFAGETEFAHPTGLALFRYEVRRWREGLIPDIDEAVEPHRLSADPDCARRLLELVPEVPTPVWGRDELRAGEMWNSNSTISWLIARSGLDVESIALPHGGRAPGWHAGIVIARHEPAPAAGTARVMSASVALS